MSNDNELLIDKSSSSLNLSHSSFNTIQNTVPNTMYNANVNIIKHSSTKKIKKRKYNYFLSQPYVSASVETHHKPKQTTNKTTLQHDSSLTEVKTHLKQLTDQINDNKKQIDSLRTQAFKDNLLLKTLNPSIHAVTPLSYNQNSKIGLLKLKHKGNAQLINDDAYSRLRIENKKLKQKIKRLNSDNNVNTYLTVAKQHNNNNNTKQKNKFTLMHVISLEIINNNSLSIIEQKDFTIKQLTSKVDSYMQLLKDIQYNNNNAHINNNNNIESHDIIDLHIKIKDQNITLEILKKIAEEEQMKLKKCRETYKELKNKNNLLIQEIKRLMSIIQNNSNNNTNTNTNNNNNINSNNNISNTINENALFINKNITITERDNKRNNRLKGYYLMESSDSVNNNNKNFFYKNVHSDLHSMYRNEKMKSKSKLSKRSGNNVLSIVERYKKTPITLDNIILGFNNTNYNQHHTQLTSLNEFDSSNM